MAQPKRGVLITGAGSGLGKAMALAFGREGYHVAVTGNKGMAETAAEIREGGGRAAAFSLDVTQPEQVEQAVAAALRELGQIDVLVNNAGIEGPTAPLTDLSLQDWERTLAVNLTGAFLCDRAVAGHMISRRSGSIIHIASVGGLEAYPLRAPYAVSKRGMIALTETLAAELGPYQVRVNALCPGPVRGDRMQRVIRHRARAEGRRFEEVEKEYTRRTALQRMVDPEDVVRLVLFLASDASQNITGQSIRVCAGYRLF